MATVSLALAAPTASEEGIPFQDDVVAAMRAAAEANRPLVVYFYEPSCQWCRRMQMTTFTDRRVTALAGRFVWLKVDVSRNQELAALAGVRGVPHLLHLDPEGRTISEHSGYLTADQLLTLLWKQPAPGGKGADLEATIVAMGKKLASATQPAQRLEAVLPVVEALASPQPGQRTAYLAALGAVGPSLWEGLVECLGDERLAVRAAAAEVLATVSGGDLPFDAFAAAPQRKEQLEVWRKWVRENQARPAAASHPMTELRVPGIRPKPTSRPATSAADFL